MFELLVTVTRILVSAGIAIVAISLLLIIIRDRL